MSTEAFNVFNNKRLGILLKSQDFPIYHNNFDLNIDNSVDIDLLKNNLDIRLLSNINNLSSPSYLLLDVEREETPAFSVHFNDSNQLDKTPDFNEAIENYNLREPFITSNQLHPQSPLENNVLVPVTLFPSRPVMTPTEMLNFQLPTKIPSIASNVNIKKTTSPRNASLLQEPILKSTKNQHNFIPRPHNLTPEPNMVLKKKLSPQSRNVSLLQKPILKSSKSQYNFISRPHNLTPEPNTVLKKKLSPQSRNVSLLKEANSPRSLISRQFNGIPERNMVIKTKLSHLSRNASLL